jgi:Pentapeptide repeats (8 copies)
MDFASLIIGIVAFLVGVGLTTAYFSYPFKRQSVSPYLAGSAIQYRLSQKWTRISARWWAGWLHSFSAKLVSAIVTAGLFSLLLTVVQQNEITSERKRMLILQMGSPNQEFAIEAARHLNALGWLSDGSLEGATLYGASLSGAELSSANLSGVNLYAANLSGANLYGANLSGAELVFVNLSGANLPSSNLSGASLRGANLNGAISQSANLSGADLYDANLSGAHLPGANLNGALLQSANLSGAGLYGANLSGAYLEAAEFDVKTTLPDGTKWTPYTDMTRFTDPQHPNFWRSNNPHHQT